VFHAEAKPFELLNDGTRIFHGDLTEAAGSAPCGRNDLSAGPSKTWKVWMERSGARALRCRPGEQSSAPSAVLRVLRVNRLLLDRGVRLLESFKESDPREPERFSRSLTP